MRKIAVLGAGSWGTALSIVLSDNNHDVRLWSHRKEQVDEINEHHTNKRYLDVTLPEKLRAYHSLEEALKDVEAILVVLPSSAIREIAQKIKSYISDDMLLIHASKGIENDTPPDML